MTELLADVPGGVLRVRVRGPEDGPRILVLHGGPGLSDVSMDGLIDEFADAFRVATSAQRVVPPPISGTTLQVDVMEAGQSAMRSAQTGLAERLRASAVPILFIVGDGGPVPATASTDTAAVIGGAVSVASLGGGHFPWLAGPGAVRATVDRVLAG